MAYTCDGPHPEEVPADMLVTQLSDGDVQALCQSCYLESCIKVAAAIADAMAQAQASAPPDDVRENEGAAQTPPPPQRGRTRRETAPAAAPEPGAKNPALPGAEHDG